MLAIAPAPGMKVPDHTLARFLMVGVGNTILGLAVIFGARQFCSDVAANLIGYLIVVPVSFLSHRDISFRDTGNRMAAFARYCRRFWRAMPSTMQLSLCCYQPAPIPT